MKVVNGKAKTTSFALGVGRALRRAAKVARKTAQAYHTPFMCGRMGRSLRRNRDACSLRHAISSQLSAFSS